MSPIQTFSKFLLFLTVKVVLSQHVTFEDVTLNYLTIFGDEHFVNLNTSSLKKILPAEDVCRITVVSGVIPSLNRDAISDFPILKILQIIQRGIKRIEVGFLKNVPLLETVSLSGNRIREIKEGVFNNLNIVVLHLDHNFIEKLSKNAFDNLPKLRVLDLSHNKIKEFSEQWLRHKPDLVFVNLAYNDIEHLPDGALESYDKEIDLSYNRIKNISGNIFGAEPRKIEILKLNDNKIEKWNQDFLKNVTIELFDISNNRLECLDGDLEHFFVAYTSIIDGNHWDCRCLKKIQKWVETRPKRVEMKSSLSKCAPVFKMF